MNEKLMADMPLQGKSVIITRPAHQSEPFSGLLRSRGADIVFFPTIEIRPPAAWDEVDEAIEHNRAYDAFVFTSANAVRYFFDRARARGMGPESLMLKTIYALGSKTAEAASFYGLGAVRLPGVTNSEEMARALASLPMRHRRYLMPKGRLASSVIAHRLREIGEVIDEVIVYDTVLPDTGSGTAETLAQIGALIALPHATCVTFFSPSSVENFFQLLPGCELQQAAVAAIGETTATALRAMNVRVDIMPDHPQAEAMAEAIEEYFTTISISSTKEDL